jgi:hypothetical protein
LGSESTPVFPHARRRQGLPKVQINQKKNFSRMHHAAGRQGSKTRENCAKMPRITEISRFALEFELNELRQVRDAYWKRTMEPKYHLPHFTPPETLIQVRIKSARGVCQVRHFVLIKDCHLPDTATSYGHYKLKALEVQYNGFYEPIYSSSENCIVITI